MFKKIIVTGGDGRFAKELRKIKSNYKFIFRNKKQLNILSLNSIEKNIKTFKPNYLLHLAGLSRPMSIHDYNINKSIDLNIIGTCNLVKMCNEKNLKIIFFLQVTFIQVKKVTIKRKTLFCLGIIMVGQNWVQSQQFKCIKTL